MCCYCCWYLWTSFGLYTKSHDVFEQCSINTAFHFVWQYSAFFLHSRLLAFLLSLQIDVFDTFLTESTLYLVNRAIGFCELFSKLKGKNINRNGMWFFLVIGKNSRNFLWIHNKGEYCFFFVKRQVFLVLLQFWRKKELWIDWFVDAACKDNVRCLFLKNRLSGMVVKSNLIKFEIEIRV